MVSIIEIVNLAQNDVKVQNDLLGLGSRAFPNNSQEEQMRKVALSVLRYEQMWHDMGVAWYNPGFNDTFLKHKNGEFNPTLTPRDYLSVLDSFMRRWAGRKNEGSPEANWYKMQDELASQLRHYSS